MRWSEGDEPDPSAPPSDQQLADRLVEMGLLNAWQAKQLLDGRTKFNLGPYLIIDSIGQGGMGRSSRRGTARWAGSWRSRSCRATSPRPRPSPTSPAKSAPWPASIIRSWSRALDAGQDGNVHYLVTEYVPGMDLRKLVRRDGPLSMAGRRVDHLARWPKGWNTPTPRGSSTAT